MFPSKNHRLWLVGIYPENRYTHSNVCTRHAPTPWRWRRVQNDKIRLFTRIYTKGFPKIDTRFWAQIEDFCWQAISGENLSKNVGRRGEPSDPAAWLSVAYAFERGCWGGLRSLGGHIMGFSEDNVTLSHWYQVIKLYLGGSKIPRGTLFKNQGS